MVFQRPGLPLRSEDLAVPAPAEGEILIKVEACGICRIDLHILQGS